MKQLSLRLVFGRTNARTSASCASHCVTGVSGAVHTLTTRKYSDGTIDGFTDLGDGQDLLDRLNIRLHRY